jgi:hypothetical protein
MITLKMISEKFNAWRRYRDAVRELSQFSDHEPAGHAGRGVVLDAAQRGGLEAAVPDLHRVVDVRYSC